jgi:quercetin dioxygenase-like cupin family protein
MSKHDRFEPPELQEGQGPDESERWPDVLSGLVLPSERGAPPLLRERLLATIARPRLRFAPFYGRLGALFDLSDSELASLFERAENVAEWTSAPVAHVSLLHLQGGPRVAQADNGLVRVAAAAVFPPHRHLGCERVLVLQGAYRDEPSGRIYRAGDEHELPEGSSHHYVVLPDQDLLLAVSLSGGLEVEGYGKLTTALG